MIRNILTVLLLMLAALTGTMACAQGDAVSSFNADVGALATKVDFPDSDLTVYGAAANANIPLMKYLGLNLYVQLGTGKSDGSIIDYSYDYYSYAVTPFLRDPGLGLIGFRLSRTTLNLDDSFPVSTLKQQDLTLLTAGYFGPVTLAVSYDQSRTIDGTGPDQNYGWVDAFWYVIPDLRIGLEAGFKDAKDNYSIGFEHQPSSILPQLSYGLAYAWDTVEDSKSILLTLTYRFAPSKSLMRRYREDLFY